MLFEITIHFQHDLHNSKRTWNDFIYPTEKIISSFFSTFKNPSIWNRWLSPFPVLPNVIENWEHKHFILIYHKLKLFSLMKMTAYILGTAEIVFISYLILPIMLWWSCYCYLLHPHSINEKAEAQRDLVIFQGGQSCTDESKI